MRKAMVLGLLGLAGTLASPAFADEFTGFRLNLNLSSDTLDSTLFLNSAPPPSTDSVHESRFGYGLSGGWALNRYFALEAGLRGGSEYNAHVFDELLPSSAYFIKSHTDVKGIDLTAVGTWWIGRKFGVFGRAGMFAWKVEETMSVGNYFIDNPDPTPDIPASKTTRSADDNGFDLIYGGGIQTVLDGALMRVEYQWTEFGDVGLQNAFNLRDNKMNSLMFSIVWTL
jgi:OmpA-like transmembrane domain